MNELICPRCRSVPRYTWGLALQKPYCTECGWNCDVVARQARGNLRSLAAATALLAAAAVAVFWQMKETLAPLLAWPLALITLVGALFTLLEFLQWRRVRALQSFPAARQEPHPELEAALVSKVWQVQSLAQPRPVRLRGWVRRRLLLAALMLVLAAAAVAWAGWTPRPDTADVRLRPALPLIIIAVFSLLTLPGPSARHRRLLQYGQVTLGRATAQGGTWESGRLRYSFRDTAGQEHAGDCHDPSGTIFEEMPLIIFYDPEDPRRSVPLPCAAYDIAAPL